MCIDDFPLPSGATPDGEPIVRPDEVSALIAMCEYLIDAVRPLNALSAYCLTMGRDELIIWSASGGDRRREPET